MWFLLYTIFVLLQAGEQYLELCYVCCNNLQLHRVGSHLTLFVHPYNYNELHIIAFLVYFMKTTFVIVQLSIFSLKMTLA